MKSNKLKNRLISYMLILIVAVIIAFLVFNEYGILKYMKLENEINTLDEKIESTESEIKEHQMEIDSLQNSDVKIEQVAREKYRMHRKNEKSFRIEEK